MLFHTDAYKTIPCGCTQVFDKDIKEVTKISNLFCMQKKVRPGLGTSIFEAATKQLGLLSKAPRCSSDEDPGVAASKPMITVTDSSSSIDLFA